MIEELRTCLAALDTIRGNQRGGSQTNWKKRAKIRISLKELVQLFLK